MSHDLVNGTALTAHIVTVLMSFGTLALSGLYASWGRDLASAQNLREVRRYFSGRNWGGRTLWVVPLIGGIDQSIGHGAASLGQAWVIAATACWAVATLVAVRLIWPAERRIRPIAADLDEAMLADPNHPIRVQLAELCRPVVRGAAVCDVAFTVALALMLLQPGS